MPGGFPFLADVCNGNDNGTVGASSTGTAITASATANTKGSWVQLVASSPADTAFAVVQIIIPIANTTFVRACVDIGIGGSGSEIVIANNLPAFGYYHGSGYAYSFPLAIPAGTRISARMAGAIGSEICEVNLLLFDGGFSQTEGSSSIDSIGFVAASTKGTTITAAGTAHTKGAYSQLVASAAQDYAGFFPVALQNTGGGDNYLIDIAIGSAGNEKVIVPNLLWVVSTGTPQGGVVGGAYFPIAIPAGSTISARCQCSTASNAIDLTLLGAAA